MMFSCKFEHLLLILQKLSSLERKKLLLDVADALETNEEIIRHENEIDLQAARAAGLSKPLIERLTIKPGKVFSISS